MDNVRPKKRLVEDSFCLSIKELSAVTRGLMPGAGELQLKRQHPGPELPLSFWLYPRIDGRTLKVSYSINSHPFSYLIRIAPTYPQPPFSGVRWWFVCPLGIDGRACGRRSAKLLLPPAGTHFGCRFCHQLTYVSTRARRLSVRQVQELFALQELEKQTGIPLTDRSTELQNPQR